MPSNTPTRSPADFENLGKAFEGLAGALHEGHPIDKEDLDAACSVAHDVWPVRAGGHDQQEKEFEAARLECRACIPHATSGDLKAWARLTKACHQIGTVLRWKSRALQGSTRTPRGSAAARTWRTAPDSRAAIRRLDQKYARYAMNPVLLPL